MDQDEQHNIKEGRGRNIQNVNLLFNRIEREQGTLIQWRQATIKIIYKDCNKSKTNESQRGIFLVIIISKVYELVKITQNEKNNSKMSECKQLEGTRGQQGII